jgi:tryptophan-rich sensory protein
MQPWHIAWTRDTARPKVLLVPFPEVEVRMDSRRLRRKFIVGLKVGLSVVWPILSALLGVIVVLGFIVGRLEGWSIQESIYFAFVSGLTIGYGDLAPKLLLPRALAILIGVCGVLITAIVAAITVKALTSAIDVDEG